jgi:hypothetical protein
MDAFFEYVERMVESEDDRTEISNELEVYRRAVKIFGFQLAKKDKLTIMPGKLLSFTLFQILSFNLCSLFVLNFNDFPYISLICCRYVVAKQWLKSTSFTKLTKAMAKHATLLVVSATWVYLKKYTPRSTTSWKISN